VTNTQAYIYHNPIKRVTSLSSQMKKQATVINHGSMYRTQTIDSS